MVKIITADDFEMEIDSKYGVNYEAERTLFAILEQEFSKAAAGQAPETTRLKKAKREEVEKVLKYLDLHTDSRKQFPSYENDPEKPWMRVVNVPLKIPEGKGPEDLNVRIMLESNGVAKEDVDYLESVGVTDVDETLERLLDAAEELHVITLEHLLLLRLASEFGMVPNEDGYYTKFFEESFELPPLEIGGPLHKQIAEEYLDFYPDFRKTFQQHAEEEQAEYERLHAEEQAKLDAEEGLGSAAPEAGTTDEAREPAEPAAQAVAPPEFDDDDL